MRLEHDPEKWEPVFPRDQRESVCAEIMLKKEIYPAASAVARWNAGRAAQASM